MKFDLRGRNATFYKLLGGAALLAGGFAAQAGLLFGGLTLSALKPTPGTASSLISTSISSSLVAVQQLINKVKLAAAAPVVVVTPPSTPTDTSGGGGSTSTPTPPTTGTPATIYGINVTMPSYYTAGRYHANLFLYDNWRHIKEGDPWGPLEPELLDANGWPKYLPSGLRAGHMIHVPITGSSGVSITCTWTGEGAVAATLGVSNVVYGSNQVRFTAVGLPGSVSSTLVTIEKTNPANPVKNVDCRETSMSKSVRYDPAFIASLAPYKVVRFMDWQNTNANLPVSWTSRRTPQSSSISDRDGVSVEDIVQLANEAGVNPWVTQPWNSDATYYRNFAQYVHDHLAAGRKVYVEVGNEVWNNGFSVANQASAEGVQAGLSPGEPYKGQMERYAQKTTEVMKIWTQVFSDNPSRLVRVIATQNDNSWTAQAALGYADTAKWVDALATAPYFGLDIMSPTPTTDLSILFSRLGNEADKIIDKALENKKVAQSYGKRYIAYEAGQSIILRDNVPLLVTMSHDSRMYDAYVRFANGWKTKIGDEISWFADYNNIDGSGAWGLAEYPGQPLSQTPKLRAVQDTHP